MAYTGNKKADYRGYSRTTKRSRIRKKMKDGIEIRADEVLLLPAKEQEWLKQGGVSLWKERYRTPQQIRDGLAERGVEIAKPKEGHHHLAERAKSALDAFKERFEPVFVRYETQIADNPDLADKETMAASWIALIRDATTLNVAERSLAQLQKVFGHDEKKVTISDGRSEGDVRRDMLERLERMRTVDAVDVTPKRVEEGA
jgi:hypothetical protein